jgi:hypothetical protein
MFFTKKKATVKLANHVYAGQIEGCMELHRYFPYVFLAWFLI